eukprot:365579-Chlamydomonas_euryale.AAC.2
MSSSIARSARSLGPGEGVTANCRQANKPRLKPPPLSEGVARPCHPTALRPCSTAPRAKTHTDAQAPASTAVAGDLAKNSFLGHQPRLLARARGPGAGAVAESTSAAARPLPEPHVYRANPFLQNTVVQEHL